MYLIDEAPIIPAHPRCRCIYAGVVELSNEDVEVDGPAADAALEAAQQQKKLQKAAGSGIITVSGESVNTRIRRQKQSEHIFGSKAFERRTSEAKAAHKNLPSAFFEGTDVDKLVRPYLGTGEVFMGKDGSISEFFSVNQEIGQTWLQAAQKYVTTSRVCVKYSKNGWHAFPVKEE